MASRTLTARELLHGHLYAIEQAGQLLRSANLLYRHGHYSAAVILAVFSREELGRAQIYLERRRRALRGAKISIEAVNQECRNHVSKLQRGQTGVTIHLDPKRTQRLKELLPIMESQEYKEFRAELDALAKAIAHREPQRVHRTKLRALYVEPNDEGEWNRPWQVGREEARQLLVEVLNDYMLRLSNVWDKDNELGRAAAELRGYPRLVNLIDGIVPLE